MCKQLSENEKRLTLLEAVNILGIDIRTDVNHATMYCPACSSQHKNKRKTLDLNFEKDQYRCPRCGIKGGAMRFWGLMHGIDDVKKAAQHYYKYLEGEKELNPTHISKIKENTNSHVFISQNPPAPLDVRDKVYRRFLSMLTLTEKHYENLKKRGLSDEMIKKGMYKSFPTGNTSKIVTALLSEGLVLDGVSGFYKKESGSWEMNGTNYFKGFFVPIINGNGQIQSLQIRLDNAENCKYIFFSSSNQPNGTMADAAPHLSKGVIKKIILTEGPLKADIISALTGWYCIGIPGVNQVRNLEPALKAIKNHGFDKIYTAFDMDMFSNVHVQTAYCNLCDLLRKHKLHYTQLLWNKEYKGLDDYLVSCKSLG